MKYYIKNNYDFLIYVYNFDYFIYVFHNLFDICYKKLTKLLKSKNFMKNIIEKQKINENIIMEL